MDVLCGLVEANENGLFNKPIVLQAGSIVEAALSEIISRANFNREGVPNIAEADRQEIAGKKIDKFNTIIDVMRKYAVLNGLGSGIYEELHKLRRYRNKIHIQDKLNIEGVSGDDDVAFDGDIRGWALALNHQILKHLSDVFPRPRHIGDPVRPLQVPCCF